MADIIKDIIDSASNRDIAIANFNSNVAGGKNLNSKEFYDRLEKKFPLKASTVSGGGGGGGGTGTNVFQSLASGTRDLIAQQDADVTIPYPSQELIKTSDVFNLLIDQSGKFVGGLGVAKNIVGSLYEGLKSYYQTQTGLLHQINIEAGLTGDLSNDFRESLTDASPHLARLGIGFKDLADAATRLVQDSGKFNMISGEAFVKAGAVAKAYVGTLQDMVSLFKDFEQVGIGADQTIKDIEKAGQAALNLGLRSQTITKGISTNIAKLNEYGFKNGVEGLSQMVRKATEFRSSMENVYQIAEKAFNPESALELSANLQVLGGAIGDFNDPLKLMYMATNNVEGLQDALIGAAGSLATYNSEQGRFEITGANLRRAKEMAGQLGMSLGDLSKTAIATAERTSASSALMARGLKLEDKEKEFLTNIAQMKGGKMQIEVQSEGLRNALELKDGQTSVAIEDLTQSQANLLLAYQKDFEKKDAEQIVRDQATDIENIMRDVNYIAAIVKIQAGRGASSLVDKAMEMMGTSTKDISESIKKYTTKAGMLDITKLTNEKIKEEKGNLENKDKKGSKSNVKKETENKEIKVNQYNTTPAVITEKASTSTSSTSSSTTNQNNNVNNNNQNVNQRANYVSSNNNAPYIITSGSQFTTYGGNQQNTTNASSTNSSNATQTSTSSNTSVQNQNLSQIVEKADGTYSVVTNNQVAPSVPNVVTPETQSTASTDIKSVITKETSESPLLDSVKSIERFLLSKDFTKTVSTEGVVSVSKPAENKKEETKIQPSQSISSTNVEVKPELNVTPKLETPSLVKTETPKIDYEKLTAGKTPLTLTPQQTPEVSTQEKNITAKVETPNETPTLTPQGVLSKSYDTKRFDFSSINILKEKTDNELRELSILDKDYSTKATETFKLNKESLEKYYTTIFGGTNNNTLISEKLNENKEQLSILDRNYSTKATENFKLNEVNLEKYFTTIIGGKDTENNVSKIINENNEQLSILDKNYSTKATENFKLNEVNLEKYFTTILGGKDTETNVSKIINENNEQLSILDKNYSTKATEKLTLDKESFEKHYSTILGGKETETNVSRIINENNEQLSILDKNYTTKAVENFNTNQINLEKYYNTIFGGKDTETNVSKIINDNKEKLSLTKEKETNNYFTKSQTGDINNLTNGYNSFLSSLTSNTNIGETNINTNTESKAGDTYSSVLGGNETSSIINQSLTPNEQSFNIPKGTITAFTDIEKQPLPQAVINPISSSREVSKERSTNIQDTLKEEFARIERTEVQRETGPKEVNHKISVMLNPNDTSGYVNMIRQTGVIEEVYKGLTDSKSYV